MQKQLEVKNLSISFGDVKVIKDISFTLEAGKIGCLLGPSGCGKTSLLRALAGFQAPDGGQVILHGQEVSSARHCVPPEKRDIGMVFQDFALFPHLNVSRNVAFGLKEIAGEARQQRVTEMLALVGLGPFADRFPHELSGGQQQRVALARALAPAPEILLLDEPFSSLDSQLRESLAGEVRALLKAQGVTAILVTHDQQEAFAMADHITLLDGGRIVQQGPPQELYQQPANEFAARFMGAGQVIKLDPDRHGSLFEQLGLPATPMRIMVRPEAVIHSPGSDLQLEVTARTFRGAGTLFELELGDGQRIPSIVTGHHPALPGEQLPVRFDPGLVVVLPD